MASFTCAVALLSYGTEQAYACSLPGPQVQSVWPRADDVGVPINTLIWASGVDVDFEGVLEISLLDDAAQELTLAAELILSTRGTTFVGFRPAEPLQASRSYRVRAFDLQSGEDPLVARFNHTFTTGSNADEIAPAAPESLAIDEISISPADEANSCGEAGFTFFDLSIDLVELGIVVVVDGDDDQRDAALGTSVSFEGPGSERLSTEYGSDDLVERCFRARVIDIAGNVSADSTPVCVTPDEGDIDPDERERLAGCSTSRGMPTLFVLLVGLGLGRPRRMGGTGRLFKGRPRSTPGKTASLHVDPRPVRPDGSGARGMLPPRR